MRSLPLAIGRQAAILALRRWFERGAAGEWLGRQRGRHEATIFSFVVDAEARFAYEGYHLARSLMLHARAEACAINVHFTHEVSQSSRAAFVELGCRVHELSRFGDGKFCNKIAQLDALLGMDFDRVVLLDTDMIVVADIEPFLKRHGVPSDVLVAKTVDLPNPSCAALAEIAHLAGIRVLPTVVQVEAALGETYLGNCNGGFYLIPNALCAPVAAGWRKWALWLLDHSELLEREGQSVHVDQVAMWLTIHAERIPFEAAAPNLNYFVHIPAVNRTLAPGSSISILHYHSTSLDVVGLLAPQAPLNVAERAAVDAANQQIASGFHSTLFWNLRYERFAERGSGVGSRGENVAYKRSLLRREGVEAAASVLDVGCGDLEVVRGLDLSGYVGIDSSEQAIRVARLARPDWRFLAYSMGDDEGVIPEAEWVICFEVLIHQRSVQAYDHLLGLITSRTRRTLLVSGFDEDIPARICSSMIFFHSPLVESLQASRRFRQIRQIGDHTTVKIYRCDV